MIRSARWATACAGVSLAVLLTGCADSSKGGGGSGDIAPGDRTPTPGELGGSGDRNVVQLAARDFSFSPTSFVAVDGQTVNISLTNDGDALHNFSNADFSVDTDVAAGQTVTVSFKPTKKGTFTFQCKYHAARKMSGTFTVS